MDTWIRLISVFVLAAMVPLAVLISRDRLRRYRSRVLIALEAWILRRVPKKAIPSFEVARIKYELAPRHEEENGKSTVAEFSQITTSGSLVSFFVPAAIYSALSALGFVTALLLAADKSFWETPNFVLSGMYDVTEQLASPELTMYQWETGAAMTAGFIGAYLFTLQYLVGRVRNYELSPTSFLIASISLIEGCFVVGVARHMAFGLTPRPAFVGLAFLLGYFPTFGISWVIEQLRVRNLKKTEPAAYDRRFVLPTDMIDGVDMLIKFRLMEAGVQDVQNLATANPVLLYVETPYNLLTILDWIAQAQLIVALGGRIAADLRNIGVRTIFDIGAMADRPETRMMVLQRVWPDAIDQKKPDTANKEMYEAMINVLTGDIHVRRLRAFWNVMTSLVEPETMSHDTKPPVKDPANDQGDIGLKEAAD